MELLHITRKFDDQPFDFPTPAFDRIEDFGDPHTRENPRLLCDYGRNHYEDGLCTGYCLDVRIPGYRGLPINQIEAIGFTVDGVWIPDACKQLWYQGRHVPLADVGTGKLANDWLWQYRDPLRIFLAIPGGIAQGLHLVRYGISLRDHYATRACCEKEITIV